MILIYSTFPDEACARHVSRALVEGQLVACTNIMAPHHAVYRWEGRIEESAETAVLFKTRAALFEAVKDKILDLHPYDCPCVIALPIEKGYTPFLEWVERETTSQ
ncbi:MAG: divalent-cation tolerance protein CutA [Alphaproteobacteria bacterium]|nr:divalent-cation tolerance protein CutA [Alphaproteobacteria bacterium]